jgi:hypothetical protein
MMLSRAGVGIILVRLNPSRLQGRSAYRLWVADITYIPTWMGFLYLAVALDA